jgi:NTP pyrophosphatase (non-canonical NTP hydrolase)
MFRDETDDTVCLNWLPVPKAITVEDYRQDVLRTARKDLPVIDQITNAAMGASGEAGELVELIKKYRYQGHGLNKEKAIEEAGDALYYLVLFLEMIGSNIDEAIRRNVEKRLERYPNGFEAHRSRGR